MGAQESKKWTELTPETPQAQNPKICDLNNDEDPRSPSVRYQRTPIHIEDYEESPQNLELHNQIQFDPRSPTTRVPRTPICLDKSTEKSVTVESDEVFETRPRSNSEPPSPVSKTKENETPLSPEAPLTKKDKQSLLKQTSSPADLRRRRRVSRKQSVPQKLFSDSKVVPVARSPLVQRNRSEGSDVGYNAKTKKFTFVPKTKKSGFVVYEDLCSGKENAENFTAATNPLAVL